MEEPPKGETNMSEISSTVQSGNPDTVDVTGGSTEQTTGTEPTTQQQTQPSSPFKAFATQEEFDNHASWIRKSAEKAAETNFLKQLGLNPDQKDQIESLKKLRDSSLTETQKLQGDVMHWQSEAKKLQTQVEDLTCRLSMLTKFPGKSEAELKIAAKMAKGLVDENTTIDQAIEQVMMLLGVTATNTVPGAQQQTQQNLPTGVEIVVPDPKPVVEQNPFKKGPNGESPNMTAQTEMFRRDPEKAKKLAKEAGVRLGW